VERTKDALVTYLERGAEDEAERRIAWTA